MKNKSRMDILISRMKAKLSAENVDINNQEECYKIFDRCVAPKILKDAYQEWLKNN